MFAFWSFVTDVLVAAWQVEDAEKRLLAAAIGHAISFQTWQSLARQHGLEDREVVALMSCLVKCAQS
jgi:hypothetical protein